MNCLEVTHTINDWSGIQEPESKHSFGSFPHKIAALVLLLERKAVLKIYEIAKCGILALSLDDAGP